MSDIEEALNRIREERLRPSEIAQLLRMDPETVARHIERGLFPGAIDTGRKGRRSFTVPKAGVLEYVRSRSVQPE